MAWNDDHDPMDDSGDYGWYIESEEDGINPESIGFHCLPISWTDSDIEEAWRCGTLENLIQSLVKNAESCIRDMINQHLIKKGLKR